LTKALVRSDALGTTARLLLGDFFEQLYLDANLALKEEILTKTTPPAGRLGRYRPGDKLLAFLKNLQEPQEDYVP
jgi:hypothetical protein